MANDIATQSQEVPDYGPAMSALNDRQRGFVMSLLEYGDANHTRAAMAAGYLGSSGTMRVTAHRLAHDPRIQAAIQEQARRQLGAGVLLASSQVLAILMNPRAKDEVRLKAAAMIFNRAGMHETTEHHLQVEHTNSSDKEMVAKITNLATTLGLDPRKLLGTSAPIDAEFTVIEKEEWEL